MKKLQKLRLNDLSKVDLAKREQNMIRGGGYDICVGDFCPCWDDTSARDLGTTQDTGIDN